MEEDWRKGTIPPFCHKATENSCTSWWPVCPAVSSQRQTQWNALHHWTSSLYADLWWLLSRSVENSPILDQPAGKNLMQSARNYFNTTNMQKTYRDADFRVALHKYVAGFFSVIQLVLNVGRRSEESLHEGLLTGPRSERRHPLFYWTTFSRAR